MDFNDFFKSIKTEIRNLAQQRLKESFAEAQTDGETALDSMKQNIHKWSLQLINKEISLDDFNFQMLTMKDSMEMLALKEAGLKEIELDKFKNDIIGIVVDKAGALV